jgi:hypothetical protein
MRICEVRKLDDPTYYKSCAECKNQTDHRFACKDWGLCLFPPPRLNKETWWMYKNRYKEKK